MSLPLLVGMTGASGAIYGIELLRALERLNVPRHLIVSDIGAHTIAFETGLSIERVHALADRVHDFGDLAAPVASGSFRTRGMIIAPCSIKTLSAVANSFCQTLMVRAADVTLKERRPLILMVRETPLHAGHLRLMAQAAEMGAVLLPPMPAFYNRPETILDIVHHTVGRALDLVGIDNDLGGRWQGPGD